MTVALGVLGGMGCLASAEFTRTVYELNVLDFTPGDVPRYLILFCAAIMAKGGWN